MQSSLVATRSWLAALVIAAVTLAGCHGPADDGPTATTDPPTTFAPAESGTALTKAQIAQLAAVFDDQPLSAGQQPWPEHLIKWVTNDVFIFLHFDNADPLQANNLNWMGIGKKGVFCAEAKPGADWRHFHSYQADNYAAGHGGEAGAFGYWLLHAPVRTFTAPWGEVHSGVDHGFMFTDPPTCGDNVPSLAGFPDVGSSALSAADITALNAIFDDQPLSQGQTPWPEHALLWVTPDTFLGLHFNHADPDMGTALNWYVLGKKSTFCASTKTGDEFRHFHSHLADNYDAGHGGDANQPGYWLMHIAVRDFDAPWGAVKPGVDYQFMYTPPPAC